MKIAIVCTMLNGFGRKGFYNSQEIGLGRAIASYGHDVWIYKGVRTPEVAETLTVDPKVTIQYIPMHRFGPHGYLKTSLLDPSLDAMLCFSDQQQFVPHIEAFCRKHHIIFVPYVGTAHSLHSGLRGKIMDFLFSQGTLKLYHRLPVLAKTLSARDELLKLGAKDVTVANVGLDITALNKNFISANSMVLKKSYGFSPDDIVICNVARLEPEKRTLQLIDLFDKIKDKKKFKLLIVGEGSLRQQIDQKISALSLQNHVKIIKRIPYEDMWEIYVLSDYFVNMNLGEIFGMAIMEAVYYETSVAAIDALGPRTTLHGMHGHKLCNSDEEIGEWLIAPYPSQSALQESSQKMVQNFSWNQCASAFLAIVHQQKAIKASAINI